MDCAELAERLAACLPAAREPALRSLATALHSAWSEPQRAYHTLQHLQECLSAFDAVRHLATEPAAIELALIFHDAIYFPERHDNEARSAAWAEQALSALDVAPSLSGRTAALVLATAVHRVPDDDPHPSDVALLLDIDLAILGAAPERFAEYELQIRREYGFVPEADYRAARRGVMQGFARREPLFLSAAFRDRLGAPARRNLQIFL